MSDYKESKYITELLLLFIDDDRNYDGSESTVVDVALLDIFNLKAARGTAEIFERKSALNRGQVVLKGVLAASKIGQSWSPVSGFRYAVQLRNLVRRRQGWWWKLERVAAKIDSQDDGQNSFWHVL